LKNTYILLEQNAKKVDLQINTTKTKVLTQTRANNPTVQNITIGVQKIDALKHFTYLGTLITSICNEMEEIIVCIVTNTEIQTYPSIYQNTIIRNSNTSGINVWQRNMGHDKENRKYNKFI
jgi:hypothetical protein